MDSTRTIRLLVVEDNPAYLYLIENAFASHKSDFRWALTVATDGEQAVSVLFTEEKDSAPLPDLVLLDWDLPKISGSEVLQRIKSHRKLRRIPVLVFSASEADNDIQDAYDNHANGYITKPKDIDVLRSIVNTIGQFWVAIAKLPMVLR